jgi:formiminotetrahydrofolate cyclodeaminase
VSLFEQPVVAFLDDLASKRSTPGGGSAAALAGAMAAGLVAMVCRLSLGREPYAAHETLLATTLDRAETIRARLTAAVVEDAAAFRLLMAAMRHGGEVEAAAGQAAAVPLEVAALSREILELAGGLIGRSNPNVASDIEVAAWLALAAIESAAANVAVNLPLTESAAGARLSTELASASQGARGRAAQIAHDSRPTA